MLRRWLLCLCALSFPLLFSLCVSAATTQPNVVIFLLDDVGQGDVGAFGNNVVHTPNIDQLAREGMRFDNAFLTTSSCSPSEKKREKKKWKEQKLIERKKERKRE